MLNLARGDDQPIDAGRVEHETQGCGRHRFVTRFGRSLEFVDGGETLLIQIAGVDFGGMCCGNARISASGRLDYSAQA